jgi:hypothetical protein
MEKTLHCYFYAWMQDKITSHSAMNCFPRYFVAKIDVLLRCLNICVTRMLAFQCTLLTEKEIENCWSKIFCVLINQLNQKLSVITLVISLWSYQWIKCLLTTCN